MPEPTSDLPTSGLPMSELPVTDQSLLGLRGKVAVVTGGSRGIGAASARLLAQQGVNLAVLGRSDSDQLRAIVDELGGDVKVLGLACDSADPEQIRDTYRRVRAEFGRLDILVNNAGIMEGALLGMVTGDLIDRVFGINTAGPILHMQAAARLMRKTGGSIVNLSSIIGRVGNAGQVVYGASKAAVIGMTLSAAKELAPQGIRVNAVAPGFISTDMTAALLAESHDDQVAAIKMGRVGTAMDVARVVLFLASDLSGYVTGQVLGVDGGMLM